MSVLRTRQNKVLQAAYDGGKASKTEAPLVYIPPKSFFRLLLPFALPVELLLDTV